MQKRCWIYLLLLVTFMTKNAKSIELLIHMKLTPGHFQIIIQGAGLNCRQTCIVWWCLIVLSLGVFEGWEAVLWQASKRPKRLFLCLAYFLVCMEIMAHLKVMHSVLPVHHWQSMPIPPTLGRYGTNQNNWSTVQKYHIIFFPAEPTRSFKNQPPPPCSYIRQWK